MLTFQRAQLEIVQTTQGVPQGDPCNFYEKHGKTVAKWIGEAEDDVLSSKEDEEQSDHAALIAHRADIVSRAYGLYREASPTRRLVDQPSVVESYDPTTDKAQTWVLFTEEKNTYKIKVTDDQGEQQTQDSSKS